MAWSAFGVLLVKIGQVAMERIIFSGVAAKVFRQPSEQKRRRSPFTQTEGVCFVTVKERPSAVQVACSPSARSPAGSASRLAAAAKTMSRRRARIPHLETDGSNHYRKLSAGGSADLQPLDETAPARLRDF